MHVRTHEHTRTCTHTCAHTPASGLCSAPLICLSRFRRCRSAFVAVTLHRVLACGRANVPTVVFSFFIFFFFLWLFTNYTENDLNFYKMHLLIRGNAPNCR